MATQITNNQRKTETRGQNLKPYHFKPGQSGNPKGRPREKLSKHERLVILSEIAKHQIEAAVSAGHKIAAIKEANLMEGVYQEALPNYQDNRQYNFIVQSEESRKRVDLLLKGERPQLVKGDVTTQNEEGKEDAIE